MADVIVTRKFRLYDLNLGDDLPIYRDLVNNQIKQGLQLPFDVFKNKTLIATKRFYKQLSNCVNGLRERVHRCAAQNSYFSLREYRRNQANLIEIVKILLKKGFFSDNLDEIMDNTDLSYYEIDNKICFIKNLMLREIDDINLITFYNDASEQKKYNIIVQKFLSDMEFLKFKVKSFNRSVARRLNKRFKELRSGNYAANSNYDKTILDILALTSIADVSKISDYDWKKGKQIYRHDLKAKLLALNISINNWGSIKDEKLVLLHLLKGVNSSNWINGASLEDLLKFIRKEFDELLLKEMINYYKKQFLAEINKFLNKILQDLGTQIPDCLKIPEFRSLSIPLGIDDGQVYELKEEYLGDELNSVDIRISLRAKSSQIISLNDIERFINMKQMGFSAQRGVLCFSHGKYFIHIPFKKEACEKRDGDLIASADLGLKTFATLSIFDKNREIDRKFLDQSNLGGKKENWFTSGNMLNLKSKLMEHRFVAKRQQSIRMKSKQGTVKHWYARNAEKGKWEKIDNVHEELIHQISTRIIAYLNHYEVSTLILEDLKWSKHGSRNKVGYFLSTWQVHWFFSQVQELLTNMALMHGIHVELVNPRNSSKTCWKCGEFGVRSGKTFICRSKKCVRYKIDSDLNAARNLIIRSKRYKRLYNRLNNP